MTSREGVRRWRTVVTFLASIALVACGGSEDPFSNDGGSSADAASGADAPVGGGPDATVTDASVLTCAPMPTQLIVLGDSITHCSNLSGNTSNPDCSATNFHEYLKANVNPSITLQNVSQPGAVSQDVGDSQIGAVTVGAGHALVMVFIGGNDLQPYIFISDTAAETRYATDKPRLENEWQRIYDWLENSSNFPDGVTLIMNTQYNPFDDCTAPPYNLSSYKIGLLTEFNETLRSQAGARDYATITDQHTTYLGHGHHNTVDSCPHYSAGAANWMGDLIHPNAAGHANLLSQWQKTSDAIYGANCP